MSSSAPKLFGPDRHYERWRWQIFAITWLAYVGFYLTRKSFAIAKIPLQQPDALGLTKLEVSSIDGAFFTAYAIGMFIAGICGDRFGTRRVVSLGILGCVLAALGMSLAGNAKTMMLYSVLHGLFQSTGWAPLAKNVTNFFSRRERGVVMGLWCTNYAVGGALGNAFAGWVADWLGWRASFFLPALTLFGVLLLFILAQRNRPEDVGLVSVDLYHRDSDTAGPPLPGKPSTQDAEDGEVGSWRVVLSVMRNPMVLLLALIYFCLKPARYAILAWGPQYVRDRLGSNLTDAGIISGLFDLAGPPSIILAGFISDRIFASRRMPVSVICLFLLGGSLMMLDRLPHTPSVLGFSFFVLGLLTYAPDSLVSGTAAVDFGTKRGASTASGLINSAGSFGGILGGALPGILQERWGWNVVFSMLAGAVLLAALLLLPKWNALPREKN
jgi:OPA family sugar phosphate sensor protein UhpC-like MFS transporter